MSRSLIAAAALLAAVFYVTLGTAFETATTEPVTSAGSSPLLDV